MTVSDVTIKLEGAVSSTIQGGDVGGLIALLSDMTIRTLQEAWAVGDMRCTTLLLVCLSLRRKSGVLAVRGGRVEKIPATTGRRVGKIPAATGKDGGCTPATDVTDGKVDATESTRNVTTAQSLSTYWASSCYCQNLFEWRKSKRGVLTSIRYLCRILLIIS